MPRYHFLGRAVDTYGNAQPRIGITINLANTATPAIVYENQVGGVPTSAAPQITTDSYGRFDFWVDTDDYAVTQFFDIIAEGLIYEDIDIFRGFTHHSLLSNLDEDDHPQYSTDIEYDELVASYNAHAASASVHFTEANIDSHISTSNIHFTEDSIDHGSISGLADDDHPQYTLDTTYNAHAASASVHFTEDSIDLEQYTLVTTYNAHAASASVHFTEDSIDLEQYTLVTTYNAHAASASVHFTEDSIDHANIQNIGTNTHAEIDTKIGQYNAHAASASVHFTEDSIDHGSISGLEDDDHPQYMTDTIYNAHAASASVHFTEASIDHGSIQNIGTNTHAEIDSHIASAGVHFTEGSIDHGALVGLEDDDHPQYMTDTIYNAHAASASVHFTEGSIDHANIQSIGTNTHAEIDSKIGQYNAHAASASVHFTEGSIDHVNIQSIGTATHAEIDSHIASAGVHFTEGSIDHGSIAGLGDDDHPQYMTDTIYNAHAASAGVHFTEASIDHANIQSIGTATHAEIDSHIASAGVHFTEESIDHGALVGLGDDDHPQYTHIDGRRGFTGNMIFGDGIEVSAGTFQLPIGVAVNEISDDSSSIDSDQLLTASAIQDAISGVGTTAADVYQDLLLDSIYTYVTYDDFGDQTLVDTGSSTMDYSTSGSRYDFTAGEILQSINLMDPTSPSAGLYTLSECMASIDYEDTGTPNIKLSTDGSNWEATTLDDIHTFSASASGSGLYVKYTASGIGKVKSLGVLYYPDIGSISTSVSRRKYITFYYEGIAIDEDIIVDGFYFDGSIAIDKMTIHARVAPSASNLTVDILKDGVEQSKIGTLTAGSTYERTTLAAPVQYITTDMLGLKIKTIGAASNEGEGLNVIVHYYDRE
jgi:hypothetical protein